jgi:hypothetical protein
MSEDRQFVDAQRELQQESKARRITLPSALFQQQAKNGHRALKIYRGEQKYISTDS